MPITVYIFHRDWGMSSVPVRDPMTVDQKFKLTILPFVTYI